MSPYDSQEEFLWKPDDGLSRYSWLAACALVCHYWAAFILPVVFRVFRLSRSGNVLRFISSLTAANVALPQYSRYVRRLCLCGWHQREEVSYRHWLHRLILSGAIGRQFPHLDGTCLHWNFPVTSGKSPYFTRSPYLEALPRSIPSLRQILRKRLSVIHLSNMRFERFQSILSIVEADGCHQLICDRVTCQWPGLGDSPVRSRDFWLEAACSVPACVRVGRPWRGVDGAIVMRDYYAAAPFFWCLAITTTRRPIHPSSSTSGSKLTYIDQTHAIAILRLINEMIQLLHQEYATQLYKLRMQQTGE